MSQDIRESRLLTPSLLTLSVLCFGGKALCFVTTTRALQTLLEQIFVVVLLCHSNVDVASFTVDGAFGLCTFLFGCKKDPARKSCCVAVPETSVVPDGALHQ